MKTTVSMKLSALFLDMGFNNRVHWTWLGSSRLFPTGWIVVKPLVQTPSAIHAQKCVGKTTTVIRGGLFLTHSGDDEWLSI